MRFLLSFAWRDLRASARSLRVFCACLGLGVALVGAAGGLFRQVSANLQADARALFGGDLEVSHGRPLAERELEWMRARGELSLLIEMRTMLRTDDGRSQLVELQSADASYPLYGTVQLHPPGTLAGALGERDGSWGVAVDGALARRLDLAVGDTVAIGEATLSVRAIVVRQPDRSLRADWRGPPVLISAAALASTRLVQPASRLSYRYRVRTAEPPAAWRSAALAAFPEADWEVRVWGERSERLAQVLDQVGSGLLLIGFSALFIGGLGVFNSVQAYLQGKLGTLATLRALGLRDRRLAALYVCQALILASGASLLGALAGGVLAVAGIALASSGLPLAPAMDALLWPLALAWLFGVLTAITFVLPALGRALSVSPAALFRGLDGAATRARPGWWWLAAGCAAMTAGLLVATMPDRRFGSVFVLATALILLALEGLVRLLRVAARRLVDRSRLAESFALRLALANVNRAGSPLRAALLSLGSALTLLVASTLVAAALLRTVNETVPENAPALVFYDVHSAQLEAFRALAALSPGLERLALAPLVLGRLTHVNGRALREDADARRALAARDEHKLSDRAGNIDDVVIRRGAWWPLDYAGPALVAMEDREADRAGVGVGDRLRFDIMGRALEARVAAIYSQRRFQSRLWLEAIFSAGALDPYVTRYVGAAYMRDGAAQAQDRIAAAAPNVVTVRTEALLNEARTLLARAGGGLAVVAGVTLVASLLVLASVVAASLVRQVYQASVLNVLGARVSVIRRGLQVEYALLAVVTSVFAVVVGTLMAALLLHYRLDLELAGLYWTGVVTAAVVSACSLGAGAAWMLRQLRIAPAQLLRSGA
ncbi:MAG: ABC transporter permease [Betaproteobacteria bacterium]|nr:ABC transporter permease [Betaproteobacteria bacterium]